MTREHKLALIIGFSLILFVGILISDHLSKAGGGVYQDPPDAEQRLAETVGPMDVGLGPRRLPDRAAAALEQHRAAADRSRQRRQADQRQADQPQTHAPGEAAGPSSPLATAEIASPEQPLLIPVEPAGVAPPGESLVQSGWRLIDQVVSGIGEGTLSPRPALEIEQSRGAPAPGAVLPEEPFVTHVVQPDESLYQIAQDYYGAGAQWTRIRDFNAGRVGEDGLVRVGVTIRIPGVEDRPTASSPRSAAAASQAGQPAPAAQVRTYTVRKNDTLGEIAQQLLGSARRRAEIVALNRDKIANEDEIRVGMVLAIPAG